jgi:hypothetical protein
VALSGHRAQPLRLFRRRNRGGGSSSPLGWRGCTTDEAILEALRDIAYEQGSPPRPENLDDPSEELPGVEVVVLRFGTWQEAIAAAGLEGGE